MGEGPNKNYATVGHTGPGARSRDNLKIFGPPPICETDGARDLKFFVHIEGWGPQRTVGSI